MLNTLALPHSKAVIALGIGVIAAATGWVWGPPGSKIAGTLLAFGLAWASLVDVERLKLPNLITYGFVAIGLADGAMAGWPVFVERAIGAVVGYFAFVGVAVLYRRLRERDGLGAGDAKLLATGGAWLGWYALPWVVVAGSLAALAWIAGVALVGPKRLLAGKIAFGPFLSIGIWVNWLWDVGGLTSS